jgi:hypothetical protein
VDASTSRLVSPTETSEEQLDDDGDDDDDDDDDDNTDTNLSGPDHALSKDSGSYKEAAFSETVNNVVRK